VDPRSRLDKVLGVDTKLTSTYDFGSSINLKLRVTGVRKGSIGAESVRLPSRNDPPEWTCLACGAPATQVDTEGWGYGETSCYCDAHVPADFDKVFLLPVVNSPRMGVCAYTDPEPGSRYANL
jgi:hypothetical protein